MSFMRINQLSDDFHATVEGEVPGPVMGVWAQTDTWDTHVFVLSEDNDRGGPGFYVGMWNIPQDEKGTRASMDDIDRALAGDPADDEATVATLDEAVAKIADYHQMTFTPGEEGDALEATLNRVREKERLDGMSKYARKVHNRGEQP